MLSNNRKTLNAIFRHDNFTDQQEALLITKPIKDLIKYAHIDNRPDNPPTEVVIAQLEDGDYPTHLDAVDNSEVLSPEFLKCGNVFFDEYEDSEKKDLIKLQLACVCGCYPAMQAQMELYVTEIFDTNSEEKLKELHTFIERFCKLYWTVGFEESCDIYLRLGKHFEEAKFEDLKDICYERAAKYYFLAEEFSKDQHSLDLLNLLYPVNSHPENSSVSSSLKSSENSPDKSMDQCAVRRGWKSFKEEKEVVIKHISPRTYGLFNDSKSQAETLNNAGKLELYNSIFKL